MAIKILFVDDEQENLDMVIDYFQTFDFPDITGVQTGEQAIAFIKEHNPDLVLLDISLGETAPMNGMDILKESVKISPESKVVMVSAYGHYESEARAIGCHDYVLKPYLPKQLFQIAKILDQKRG